MPRCRCRWTACIWPTWSCPGSAAGTGRGPRTRSTAFGFLALLRRLRTPAPGEVVYAPAFERSIEQPIAGSIPVGPAVPLIITEGNYLLLDDPPWHEVRPLLDETWFVEIDDAVRVERLIRRHIEFGKTPEQAAEWVQRLDEQNARLVAASRERADLIVRGG